MRDMQHCSVVNFSSIATIADVLATPRYDIASPIESLGTVKRPRLQAGNPRFAEALSHKPRHNDALYLLARMKTNIEQTAGITAFLIPDQVRLPCHGLHASRGHNLFTRFWRAFWSGTALRHRLTKKRGACSARFF